MTTPWWGTAAGDLFLGATKATQADPYNTSTKCYSKASGVRDLIYETTQATDPTTYLNAAQQFNILYATVKTACGLDIFFNFLDSRMSNMDYTLGILSNVLSQIFTGWTTQNHVTGVNSQKTIPVWSALNAVWIEYNANADYTLINYENIGMYLSIMSSALLNFKSPSTSVGLSFS